ncbi:MAG: hypothetical protein K6F84_04770 [Lachnospiraceae bacterium]|nr:hypothetical protein [Lachnospiraceae bacterium]
MQLTRKFLASKGLEANVIDEIIEAYTGDVIFIKDVLDEAKKYEADAKKYETANAELKELKDYDKLKKEFEDYKLEVKTKAERSAKEKSFKELLTDLGIPDKHLDRIVKYSDVDGIRLDSAGKITDSSELIKIVKEEWDALRTIMGIMRTNK